MKKQIVILLLLLGFTVGHGGAEDASSPQGKAGYRSEPGFGGPNETGAQLAEDDAVKEVIDLHDETLEDVHR